MTSIQEYRTGVLIVGGGAAGLSAAIRLAEDSKVKHNITLMLKDELPGGASYWAQGGIAVPVGEDDSVDSHIADTLNVGGQICHEDVVRYTVEQAREQLDWLLAHGVRFTENEDADQHASEGASTGTGTGTGTANSTGLHLTREGGHSFRRIVHADDATGAAIQTRLAAVAHTLPNLQILTRRIVTDMIRHNGRCTGAWVYDEANDHLEIWHANAVILATGGASRAWLHATNPEMASGDGIAMGWRAGCRVANLEFMQFHPTCLYLSHEQARQPGARTFLMTEALRGEGAYLRLPDGANGTPGTRFMPAYHELAELAPRDVVARAIDAEIKKPGVEYVLLDISHRPADFVRAHFPTIHAYCLQLGIDITREPIPVVPAAHYTCGGIMTDLNGATDIPGLYAVGEVAFTGLHGANRIASNSLLECFVFAAAACAHILAAPVSEAGTPPASLSNPLSNSLANPVFNPVFNPISSANADPGTAAHAYPQRLGPPGAAALDHATISRERETLRRLMRDHVGIVRTAASLDSVAEQLAALQKTISTQLASSHISRALLELDNLALVASLIVRCARSRKESRGLHYMADYPELDAAQARDTVLSPEFFITR